ncbi:MAG: ABC transporter ATP-binding protein/permease [Acidimicrobiia bacterium]|nr:ABC transporter ATP-binding protein/permease [Acidimicrobiia bacterium]
MTERQAPTARLMVGSVRYVPWRYLANVLLWSTIWLMPVIPALITREFFDSLELGTGVNPAWFVAGILAYGLGRTAIMFLAMHNDVHLEFRVSSLLRRNMIGRIYEMPAAQAVQGSPGEMISRFREDVDHVQETLSWTVDMVGASLFGAVAVWILSGIDGGLTLAVFAPLIVMVVVAERFGGRIKRYREEAQAATGRITEAVGEMFGAVQSVKVAGAEASMVDNLRGLNDRRRRAMVKDKVLTAGLESVFWNTVSIGTGLILLIGAASLAADNGLTIGEFALFVYFLGFVTDAGYFVGIFIARFKQAGVSYTRMVKLLRGGSPMRLVQGVDLNLNGSEVAQHAPGVAQQLPRNAAGVPAGVPRCVPLERLEARRLGYRYPGSDNGIAEIDLDIARGSFTVVTGRIGAGKTTLLRVLLGLLPADSGEIRWNGEKIADPGMWMVPPHAAYTPQVPSLFSMSLRDNLRLGRDDSDDEIRAAIRAAALERDLEDMPDGLDTMVGPRGMRLSGGQVQRTAAARMLLRRPELLVFDDLSSALDVETEQTLWSRLLEEHNGATALVVSHRRPALQRADQIIVMEDGRIAAIGTFADLRESSDAFNALWTGIGNGA